MKKIFFVFFILLKSLSYCADTWHGSGKPDNILVVLYKVLDPLIVEVEQPERIVIPASNGSYRYSNYSKSRRPLTVKVSAKYNKDKVDDILRKIYERVYFKLDNNGDFELTNKKYGDKKIKGKGYFIDSEAKATETNKLSEIDKEFSGSVGAEKFNATTQVDADFIINDITNTPMGEYQGTLMLDVWFGGI